MAGIERFDLESLLKYQYQQATKERPIIDSIDRISDALSLDSKSFEIKIAPISDRQEYILMTDTEFPELKDLADWRNYTHSSQHYSLKSQNFRHSTFAIKCQVGAHHINWKLPHKVGNKIIWEEVNVSQVAQYLSKKAEQTKKEAEEVAKYKARHIHYRDAFYKFREVGIVSNYETYCLKRMLSVNGNELSHEDLTALKRNDIYDDVHLDSEDGEVKPVIEEVIIWKAGLSAKDNQGNLLILIDGEFYLKKEDGSKKLITKRGAYNFLKNLV